MNSPVAMLLKEISARYEVPEADLTNAYKLDRRTWPAKQELAYRLCVDLGMIWSDIAKALSHTQMTTKRMALHFAWANNLPSPGTIAMKPSNVIQLGSSRSRVEPKPRPSAERARAQRQADKINAYWDKRGITANARAVHAEEEGWSVASDLMFGAKKARA